MSLLPGRCRGAAAEVEEAAGTHELRSVTEQGTPPADLPDFFGTAKNSSRLARSNALTRFLGARVVQT